MGLSVGETLIAATGRQRLLKLCRPALVSRSLHMKVDFWTASAFARPLHALHRWWYGPTALATNSLSSGIGAVLPLAADSIDIAANSSNTNENINVERVSLAPVSYRPAAWEPIHFHSPCSLVTPTASQKTLRTGSRLTAARRHGTQRPVRVLHRSASSHEAGHFFIAGRMADVCAELERLAAHEAAH